MLEFGARQVVLVCSQEKKIEMQDRFSPDLDRFERFGVESSRFCGVLGRKMPGATPPELGDDHLRMQGLLGSKVCERPKLSSTF